MKKVSFFGFIQRWWPVGFIISLWLIFAAPFFMYGHVPFPTTYLASVFPPWSAQYAMPVKNGAMPDVITQIYPWKKFTIDSFRQGSWPLWNPYTFSGTPHAANYQTAIFSPFNLLFFLFSEADAWSILILLQPLLAGIGMYIFLRELERSPTASLLGSIGFMFCGFLTVWMAYGTLGYAVLWLPFLLSVIHRQFRTISWWNLISISVLIPLSFLSGHFQMSLYVAAVVFFYIVYLSFLTKNGKQGLVSCWFLFCGLLLSLPQLLLSYDGYIQSVRSMSFTKGEIIPWRYLITMIAPDFYGNPVTRNDWFGHYAEWSSYIGVIPLLLAFYGMISRLNRLTLFFVISGLTALFFALPTPFTDFLFSARIPVLSTSAASRIVVLVSFFFATLAAFGFDELVSNWRTRRWKGFAVLVIIMMIGIGLLWYTILFQKFLPFDKIVIAKRNFLLPSLLVGITFFFCFLGYVSKRSIQSILIFLLIIISSIDSLRFASKWMPFDSRDLLFPSMKVIHFLQKEIGINRVFGNFGNELATQFRIPSLEGYDALYQRRYGEFILAVNTGSVGLPQRSVVTVGKSGSFTRDALNLLNVGYFLHRKSDGKNVWTYPVWLYPQLQRIYDDSYYEVYKNPDAFPRFYLASSYRLESENQRIIDVLFSKDFNQKETILLEKQPSVMPKEGSASLDVISYQPQKITLNVLASVPKLLFSSDVYDKGWKVFLDGKEIELYRADYAFRAVGIPSGKHEVRFEYQPFGFTFGIWVAVTVLACGIMISIYKIYYAYRLL